MKLIKSCIYTCSVICNKSLKRQGFKLDFWFQLLVKKALEGGTAPSLKKASNHSTKSHIIGSR